MFSTLTSLQRMILFVARAVPPPCRCMRFAAAEAEEELTGMKPVEDSSLLCVEKDKSRCIQCGVQRSPHVKLKACAGCTLVLCDDAPPAACWSLVTMCVQVLRPAVSSCALASSQGIMPQDERCSAAVILRRCHKCRRCFCCECRLA